VSDTNKVLLQRSYKAVAQSKTKFFGMAADGMALLLYNTISGYEKII